MNEDAATKLLAIFIVVALGYLAGRLRWLGENDPARVLGNAAFYLFVPALLFRTTSRLDLVGMPWGTLLAFFVPVLALLLGVYAWQRPRVRAGGLVTAAPSVRAISASFGNTVQVGIPLATAASADAAEIARERFILFERGASIRAATDAFFDKAKVVPATVLESNDTFFIKLMVRQGVGVSLLPAWAVREEVEAGTLARVPVEGEPLSRVVQLVTSGRPLSAAARCFVEFTVARRDELQALARGNPTPPAA